MADESTDPYGGKVRSTRSPQVQSTPGSQSYDLSALAELIKQLAAAGGVPISLSQVPSVPVDTTTPLNAKRPVSVPFPVCADELMALIKTTGVPQADKDDITLYFDEYFKFVRHTTLVEEPSVPGGSVSDHLDGNLLSCIAGDDPCYGSSPPYSEPMNRPFWPTECCFCAPCVALDGNRNAPPSPIAVTPSLKRLFIGDLLWLFFFERLGIFKILGVILDNFAIKGNIPISNGSLNQPGGLKDDIIAIVLEAMVRQVKTGLASSVRERTSSYARCLGWTSDVGRQLKLDTAVNKAFTDNFHKLIFHALEFYRDLRLADAIRATATQAKVSVATLVTIKDTIDVLRKGFETFDYGRNYFHTLNGVVWSIAAMAAIRELREPLGIPPVYDQPHEYIPAAYDKLVLNGKGPATPSSTNRYTIHKECAKNGRDILLDLEVLNFQDASTGGELERWLLQIESKIEGYRTSYRLMTGIDLGSSASGTIEQQV